MAAAAEETRAEGQAEGAEEGAGGTQAMQDAGGEWDDAACVYDLLRRASTMRSYRHRGVCVLWCVDVPSKRQQRQ